MTASLLTSIIPESGHRLRWRGLVVLGLMALLMFWPGLTRLPPLDRDEALFAQATKQMIQSSDYLDIHYRDLVRYRKPIGIYWLQAGAVRLFGTADLTEIALYRLPSLIGAVVAVVMTGALGAWLFGPMAGFLAGLLLAASFMLNVEARLAKTDAALLGCIAIAHYALARAFMAREGESAPELPGLGVALSFWLAEALGILIKGPIAPLLALATVLFAKREGLRWSWLRRLRPALGVPLLFALVAPWFAYIILSSHGAFTQESAGHDLIGKLWQGKDGAILPPGLHALLFPLVFFPGSLFVLFAIPGVIRDRKVPAVGFCLAWIVPAWIAFEIPLTKLPHYTMPMLPAIAILAARGITQGFSGLDARPMRWLLPLIVALWLMVATLVAFGSAWLPVGLEGATDAGQMIASAVLLIASAIALPCLMRTPPLSVLILTLGMAFFSAVTFGHTLPGLSPLWPARNVQTLLDAHKPCPSVSTLYATGYTEPSLVFSTPAPVKFLAPKRIPSALVTDRCAMALLDDRADVVFQRALTGMTTLSLESVSLDGYNPGRGKPVRLTLYWNRTIPDAP